MSRMTRHFQVNGAARDFHQLQQFVVSYQSDTQARHQSLASVCLLNLPFDLQIQVRRVAGQVSAPIARRQVVAVSVLCSFFALSRGGWLIVASLPKTGSQLTSTQAFARCNVVSAKY